MTFVTRELSPETWQDFEALFSRGNGWDHCWCTAFQKQGPRGPARLNRIERGRVNKDLKRRLVMSGQAHGILVYDISVPIGWCQFGPATELRAPHGGRRQDEDEGAETLWRITCFVTDKRYRRLGVAGLALEAALAVIRDNGGRVVEAYPVVHW